MDHTKNIDMNELNQVEEVHKDMLVYFTDRTDVCMNDILILENDLLELKEKITKVEKRREHYSLNNNEKAHNVFSPLSVDNEVTEVIDEGYDNMLNNYKKQNMDLNKKRVKLIFYRNKITSIKNAIKITKLVKKQLKNSDQEDILNYMYQCKDRNVNYFINELSESIEDIHNKIQFISKITNVDINRIKLELVNIDETLKEAEINISKVNSSTIESDETVNDLYNMLVKISQIYIQSDQCMDVAWHLDKSYIDLGVSNYKNLLMDSMTDLLYQIESDYKCAYASFVGIVNEENYLLTVEFYGFKDINKDLNSVYNMNCIRLIKIALKGLSITNFSLSIIERKIVVIISFPNIESER